MSRVIVTKEIAQVGMSVMRGRDWSYGNQDGTPGCKGTIRSKEDDFVKVKWSNGTENTYMTGRNGKFDLYIYVPTSQIAESASAGSTQLDKNNAKRGLKVRLATNYHPYSLDSQGTFTIGDIGGTLITLVEANGTFEMKYFHIVEEHPFGTGEVVYIGNPDIECVRMAKLIEDSPYRVKGISGEGNIQVVGSDYWIAPEAFISQAEWRRRPYKPKGVVEQVKPSLGEIRSSLESFSKMSEAKEIFKPNTNTNKHGNDRNNTGPIKVRRPSCIIKGPEKRTRAFF